MEPEYRPIQPSSETPAHSEQSATAEAASHGARAKPTSAGANEHSHGRRKRLTLAAILVGCAIGAYFLVPAVIIALTTVSTDDAYVNSHVTFVNPRVLGQVKEVLVDDNFRVKKNQILVKLDPEPYEVQVAIKKAALKAAEQDVVAAKAQARGLEGMARSQRWQTQLAVDQVNNQIALLKARVEAYKSKQATLDRAKNDLERGKKLLDASNIGKEEYDLRLETFKVAEAQVKQALEEVYQTRASLGQPPQPEHGSDLTQVPPNLDQTYSSVRTALAGLAQSMAQLGLPLFSTNATPNQVLDDFKKRDAEGDIDRILDKIIPNAPAVKQAEAKLLQAQSDLDQAELNLRYCDIRSEIDGVVTRRNVNPGNNVQVGQTFMAVRSLTEIWIDANFKETQLADLRIGQRVRLEVDMYGGRREYEGRITGFTMGTGSTLALLPPENATGNFIKVVQRLPVRIELNNYDPEKAPLFNGLSVVPYVYYKEPLIGDDPAKGQFLRPYESLTPRDEPPAKAKEGKAQNEPPAKANEGKAQNEPPAKAKEGKSLDQPPRKANEDKPQGEPPVKAKGGKP